jgi:uncharacterized paraquat-inducible protein A
VSLFRGIGDPDPDEVAARRAGVQEEQRRARTNLLAVGTIACPHCDAPVALPDRPLSPADRLGCPYCEHRAPLRDFLSLAVPSRPTRVAVRVVERAPRA